jgi:cation transport regulator ChaC
MAVDVGWTQPPTIIGANIRTRRERAGSALLALCQSHGARLESRTKATSTWNDRTGNARQGIGNPVQASGNVIEIVIYHTMEYGKYLETGTSRMAKLGVMDHEIHVTAAEVTTDAAKVVRGLFG